MRGGGRSGQGSTIRQVCSLRCGKTPRSMVAILRKLEFQDQPLQGERDQRETCMSCKREDAGGDSGPDREESLRSWSHRFCPARDRRTKQR
jgi:hypothetical protein